MKKSGFSLMEIMIIMLLVSLTAAATAPMISKKVEKKSSPWVWTNLTSKSISYNAKNINNTSAIIGNTSKPSLSSMLYIDSKTKNGNAEQRRPFISFAHGGPNSSEIFNLITSGQNDSTSVYLSNKQSVSDAKSMLFGFSPLNVFEGSTGLGFSSAANYNSTTAGGLTTAMEYGTAYGTEAVASNWASALGYSSRSSGNVASAIGYDAAASGDDSVVIGANASVATPNSVVIGADSQTSSSAANSLAIGYYAKNLIENEVRVTGFRVREDSVHVKNYTDYASNTIGMKGLVYGENSVVLGNLSHNKSKPYYITHADGSIAQWNLASQNDYLAKDTVVIGSNSVSAGANSVAVGKDIILSPYLTGSTDYSSNTANTNSVAIGYDIFAMGKNSVTIGSNSVNNSDNTVAIGDRTFLNDTNFYNANFPRPTDGVAIGTNAHLTRQCYHLAIGKSNVDLGIIPTYGGEDGARNIYNFLSRSASELRNGHLTDVTFKQYGTTTGRDGEIVLGDSNTVVYVPGKLVINMKYEEDGTDSNAGVRLYRNFGQNVGTYGDVGGIVESGYASDKRLKNIGNEFVAGLEVIKKLQVFNYTFKNDSKNTPRVGVIAQDLQKIFPNAVSKGKDGYLRIRMEDMFYALVNAVKELDKKIELLAQKNSKLLVKENQVILNGISRDLKSQQKSLKNIEKRLARLEIAYRD